MIAQLRQIRNACLFENEPLRKYTRFDLGGPAALLFDTSDETALTEALCFVAETGVRHLMIGGGTNLIVADEGFDGLVLRYRGASIRRDGMQLIAEAGAFLQDVVDTSIGHGFVGMSAMTGVPGYLGGAIYGNAGAYGDSIHEIVEEVRVFAEGRICAMSNEDCQFAYRESIFKRQKEWIVLAARLRFTDGDKRALEEAARGIRTVRDSKYPPEMKCAGSIFKNQLLENLPAEAAAQVPPVVVKGGKVPSAWFLEQVGVRGMRRGDIQVAPYHANLIYNDGMGTTRDLLAVIEECKMRVQDRFGFLLEEEVQYVG